MGKEEFNTNALGSDTSGFFDAVEDAESKLEASSNDVRGEDDNRGDSGNNSGVSRDTEDDESEELDDEESSDSEEQEDEDEEAEEEAEGEVDDKPTKQYTATLEDGSQVKLQDNATIKLKVDGKFKRVSLRDLASDFNGRVKHDELIRRGAEKSKQLESQVLRLEGESKRARDLTQDLITGITQGDLIKAMGVIAEMTNNEDPEKLLQEALTGIGNAVERISGMSAEEIEKEARSYKLDTELKKKQAKLDLSTREDQIAAAKARKLELCNELGLAEAEMNGAYLALVDRNKELETQGRKKIEFTLEDVATLALEYRHLEAIEQLIEKHELEFEDQDINNLIDLSKIQAKRTPKGLTEADYVRILNNYANKEIEVLDRKVGKAKTTPKSKKVESKVREVSNISDVWGI